MKILITGFNKNQCTRKFYLRQQLKVVPSHYSLFNCLTDMGHEVEQRQVTLGEDLSGYDEVIVFIAGPRQLVATTVYEGLYAISQKPGCILAFDDWQVPDLFKGVAKLQDNPDELYAQFILDVNKKTKEDLFLYTQHFLYAIDIICRKENRMLVSAFQTGHVQEKVAKNLVGPELLFGKIGYPSDRLFVYNPNPYHRNRTFEDPGHEGAEDPTWLPVPNANTEARPEKEPRFNFASLVQSKTQKWLKKQGYTGNPKDDEIGNIGAWPVDLYGSKAETQKRLTEDEMVKVITRDWACLMPGYEHAGSGWWRARPLQCADARSILIGDDNELAVYYGDDYQFFGLKAAEIIGLTEAQRAEIAEHQAQQLFKYHPLDKLVEVAELQAVLDAPK